MSSLAFKPESRATRKSDGAVKLTRNTLSANLAAYGPERMSATRRLVHTFADYSCLVGCCLLILFRRLRIPVDDLPGDCPLISDRMSSQHSSKDTSFGA